MIRKIKGGVTASAGFQAACCAAGIRYSGRTDMAMLLSLCLGVFISASECCGDKRLCFILLGGFALGTNVFGRMVFHPFSV